MSDIQLDTLEVNHGAAILMQFCTQRGIVRVLADCDVTGYPANHVHGKLAA
jgi:hypothetical protein